MTDLRRTRNLDDPDIAYEALIAAHDGLSAEESAAFNARLILTLVNHIGDIDVLRQAIAVAALRGDAP
ncbi:hypothetical protein OCGS_2837 [Oceaniovalibus guishaninsula JLT2003]|uniref:DUF2783 domain-containing protein n=1 Tax=Oceaniovalibus guishaninsula JLT2003 TaxID=1231392 RepID=K2GKH0_9RHOB|nr:DUF2783 domain-containing protein [Oceaniovalibus guishaninsula]EKE43246.1 hypothetical protein OCGS_2837 [Oceaniovalibus guishaninsula JLT2003]